MAEELGRITRPEAEQFKQGRRLFLVPLVFTPPSPPEELKNITDRYWAEARKQVAGLEGRIGRVKKVYVEMVNTAGEEGIKSADSLNLETGSLARYEVDRGAEFMALEDGETLAEFMDWSRCLSVGLYSNKVLETVLKAYHETQAKRNQAMVKTIVDSLGEDEIGLLIISENHALQFPADIEVFYVAPPALDEFKRWLRQQQYPAPDIEPATGDEEETARDTGQQPETDADKKQVPADKKVKTSAARKSTRKKTG